jgi:cytochrome P450 family 109
VPPSDPGGEAFPVTTTAPVPPVPEVRTPEDLFDDAFFDDPYPTYAAFRAADPVYALPVNLRLEQAQETFHDDTGTWLVTGFEECTDALRRHQVFSSAIQTVPAEEQERQRLVLINTDQPRHTRLRGLLNKAMTPRRTAALEPWIRELVRELLDDAGTGDVDLVTALAEPLPILVIASLIGVRSEDLRQFKTWSDAMVAIPTPETMEENRAKTQAMHDYIAALMDDRRANPADDFLSTLLVAGREEGTGLEDWEIASFCVLLLLAGNETTRNLIACLANVLVDRPDLWAELRADRSLVGPTVEESLRYDSPVQILNRWANQDTTLGGHEIPKGTNIAVAYAAGNRDPLVFADPDAFDPHRPENRHLGFGIGIHFCLGAPLARLEGEVVLNEMLDRFPTLSRPAPAQFQHAARVIRGLVSLPLTLPDSR